MSRRLLCLILSFTLSFSSAISYAENPICDTTNNVGSPGDVAFDTACALMKDYANRTPIAEQVAKAAGKCIIGAGVGLGEGAGMAIDELSSFVKMAAVDAPKWLWEKAKSVVSSMWSKAPDAVSGASDAAEANVQEQKSILAKAREMWAAVQEYKAEVAKEIERHQDMFVCLPPEDKADIICNSIGKFISYYVTGMVTGALVVKATVKATAMARALSEFSVALNRNPSTKGLTAAEKVRAASGALANVETRGDVLRKVGNSEIVEYSNGVGDKYLKVEEYVMGSNGQRQLISSREVLRDSKTLAIDANQEQGRKLLRKVVESGDDSSVIFVDVNNLGKTNYFADGTKAGDKYLRGVGEAIHKSIGPDDLVFKLGGDEIAIVTRSKDTKEVMRTATRVVDNVDRNHDALTVFKTEQKIQAQKYRDVANAEKFEQIPEATASKLNSTQKEMARNNWDKFKDEYLAQQADKVMEQAKYRPSVSIGSAMGRGTGTLEDLLQKAEAQAAQTKIQYKSEIGLDTSKYGAAAEKTGRPNYKAKPEVLEPVE